MTDPIIDPTPIDPIEPTPVEPTSAEPIEPANTTPVEPASGEPVEPVLSVPGESMVSRADHVNAWFLRQQGSVLFLICFSVLLAAIVYHHWDVTQVSEEAVIRSGVGADLLNGLTAGRQGLVGSLVWAPLPTIVDLPLVYVLPSRYSGLAWPILAAALSALTVALLNRWLRDLRMHWLIRYPLLLAYQLCPPVLAAVLAGAGAILLLAFFVGCLHFLHRWLVTLDVRSLAYVGAFAGLALVTDWRCLLLLPILFLVVVTRLLYTLRPKGFAWATLLVFLVPAAYLASVWILSNWLIVGNPLAFLRGLFLGASVLPALALASPVCYLYLLAPLLLVLGILFGFFLSRSRPAFHLLAVVAVLLMALLVGVPYVVQAAGRVSYFELYPQRVHTVNEIVSFVEDRYPDSRVVVGGYYGYLFLARAHSPELFVHSIGLSLFDVNHRTHGKELFILLPRPQGLATWEDVYLSHPGLFADYENYRVSEGPFVAGFVFEESWSGDDGRAQWILLRMILRKAGESS